MSFLNDPVLLATAGYDHSIKFWQAATGICQRIIQHTDSQVNDLEITPDKTQIAVAAYQHVRLYDINSNNNGPIVNLDGIPKNITEIGFHKDGNWLYSACEDNCARIWDIRSRQQQSQQMKQTSHSVNTICLHPINQCEIFLGDEGGNICIWDLKKNEMESFRPDGNSAIHCISIDPDGSYMAAVNSKGTCYMWDLSGGLRGQEPTKLNNKRSITAHERCCLKCLFSPDSTLLATTSADKTTRIWKTCDLSLMTTLTTEKQRWVWDCAFSRDSGYIITASSDNCARLWTVEEGQVKKEYIGHHKAVVSLAFRDDQLI